MTTKFGFSQKRLDEFICPAEKKQSLCWDTKTPGLGCRVTSTGSKSYIFESRLGGQTLRLTIGDIRTWSIKDAQKEATRLKSLVDSGTDPRELKKTQIAKEHAARREAKRKGVTVGDAWSAYIDSNKHRWSQNHLRDHLAAASVGGALRKRSSKTTTAGPLASLLLIPLRAVDTDLIANWLKNESQKRPTFAARSYRLLRAFIRWTQEEGQFRGIVPHDVYKSNAVRRALPRSNKKDDCLQREQLPLWFNAVRQSTNPVISVFLQTLLLVGARREEWSQVRWSDVDFQWNHVSIKDKIDGQRIIPLTPFVAQLLNSLPRRNEWVFSSNNSESGRLTEPAIFHRKALSMAGLPPITLHGLRRSFGTLSEWVEVPVGIVAQIQGHKPSAIAEKHYRVRPVDLLRQWHSKIERWILEQANIPFVQTESRLQLVK